MFGFIYHDKIAISATMRALETSTFYPAIVVHHLRNSVEIHFTCTLYLGMVIAIPWPIYESPWPGS